MSLYSYTYYLIWNWNVFVKLTANKNDLYNTCFIEIWLNLTCKKKMNVSIFWYFYLIYLAWLLNVSANCIIEHSDVAYYRIEVGGPLTIISQKIVSAQVLQINTCTTGIHAYWTNMHTVLVLTKFTKFAVALRFGSCKLIFFTLFHHSSLNLRTVYIVWSLVRRRVTRRLTRLQTMCNVLKYRKIL